MVQRALYYGRLFTPLRVDGAGAAQSTWGFVATLRVSVLLAAALLSACAAPPKKPAVEAWPEYQVSGSLGLVFNPPVTPIKLTAGNEDVARLESAAEKKRKEASMGVGVTAFTILTAPLAILAPLYPPAIQLAALPFMAADATAKAGQDADRLKQEAAKARLDLACSEQLAAAHPELAENLQLALAGDALRATLRSEIRDSLQVRTHVPVALMDAWQDGASRPDVFLKEAEERHLPTVVEIEIQSIDFGAEAIDSNPGICRYKVTASANLAWWNVATRLHAFRADSLARGARLQLDAVDLPALVDRPEELRLQLAKGFRDIVIATLATPTLKFPEAR
jgi:hypothetical protein